MNKKTLVVGGVVGVALSFLWAAGRVEMSTPILRTSPDEIVLTTSFTAFDPDSEYRLGIGAKDKSLKQVEIKLLKNDDDYPRQVQNFNQGYMASWFNVDEVQARGYVFRGSDLGGPTAKLTLKIQMTLKEADRIGRFYIFVAKNYGANTWYLEDGSEADKSLW